MQYRCKVCGEIFEVKDGETPVCPRCRATGEKLEPIVEAPKNKYAGTETEKNLHAAFDGESGARNKYTYFASVAKKEGYEQIAALFLKTAENEREHAKMWLKELNGIGNTAANLKTTSGQICTKALQRPPRQKASMSWRKSSAWSARSKSIMKSATARCFIM